MEPTCITCGNPVRRGACAACAKERRRRLVLQTFSAPADIGAFIENPQPLAGLWVQAAQEHPVVGPLLRLEAELKVIAPWTWRWTENCREGPQPPSPPEAAARVTEILAERDELLHRLFPE